MDFLPIFPLQLVVFPGEYLNLHIFEPRYKQLIGECEHFGNTFGIPAFIHNKMMSVGTELCLLKIEKKYSNGEMDIKTQGLRSFEIQQVFNPAPGKLYAAAEVEKYTDNSESDVLLARDVIEKIVELYQVMKIKRPAPDDPAHFKSFDVAHHVGLNLEQEYQMLCLRSEPERQLFLLEHLTNLIPVAVEMEELRKKIEMNGHFKNMIPPQM